MVSYYRWNCCAGAMLLFHRYMEEFQDDQGFETGQGHGSLENIYVRSKIRG